MPADVPPERPSSVRKRAAALAAGRELFVGDGYERTSVDAIAARAGISKRTVYDYFGDKDGVFDAVVREVAAELGRTLRAAVDEELTTGGDVRDALLAFVRRVATGTFASSEYRLLRQLVLAGRWVPGRDFPELDDLLESLLSERFGDLIREGILRSADPHRAAQHFIALTLLVALDVTRDVPDAAHDVDALLVDGVDAFVRAYRG